MIADKVVCLNDLTSINEYEETLFIFYYSIYFYFSNTKYRTCSFVVKICVIDLWQQGKIFKFFKHVLNFL